MDVPPGVACLDTRHPRRLLAPEQVPMRFSIYDRPSTSCGERAAHENAGAPAQLVEKSGRDGGGKPRQDYGQSNLSSRALNVVRVRYSLVKTRLNAGGCML